MFESVKLSANLAFEKWKADSVGSSGLHFAGGSGKSHDVRVLVETCIVRIDVDDYYLSFLSDYVVKREADSYCSPITNKEVLKDLCQFRMSKRYNCNPFLDTHGRGCCQLLLIRSQYFKTLTQHHERLVDITRLL